MFAEADVLRMSTGATPENFCLLDSLASLLSRKHFCLLSKLSLTSGAIVKILGTEMVDVVRYHVEMEFVVVIVLVKGVTSTS